ncbi:Auxilin-related protein 2 [Acorus calamus]|uniref:Auxilin-related protein 2 n=1 Tax=Acorus calamus TaxID=4465 RepID=A0AAV9DQV6_ACOCL|nr:Auxilin-related protein 2 [Acorus calamus]
MPKPALRVPKNQIGPEENKQDHQKMDKEEMIQREREQENEHLRKHEEEIEREREREKDRIAVERATREARERVMVESRQRAERAAVDKATAEVRQRAMTEAREKAEKATAEAREKSLADKAAAESKLRAQQRAAVERATAEARERAAEKAVAEKAALDARERAERSFSEKSTAPSRDRQSTSVIQDVRGVSHDQQFHNGGSSNAFFHKKFQGAEVDSPRRCKARLERHQRTVERAAKALAEKNFRDILAQREQAERNRLADTLDADVRRWSNGKEGNLRALISTLQYILGPESGWQPVPLTEVITAQAVRKAYRKATLCVHPDKLQQRGASIRQKYICEKVFDLLKEAWNKFDSEER